MKPILLDFPMPITTERLLLRLPMVGEGKSVNNAIRESFNELQSTMPWALILFKL